MTGADGVTWWVGDITADGNTLTMPITPAEPAGPCKINYEVVSAAGDPVSGEVAFTLARAVPATSTPPAPTESAAGPITGAADSGGPSGWIWVVVAAVGVGLVVGLVLARVGRARPATES
ncbi:MAG: copper resistance protein CopC [Actinophytocola sp.]|uniref:copper resistance protein CopC n=1 Tax=Actinophytocola sp. TaxID=1872138 RepID=UPI003D6C4F5D